VSVPDFVKQFWYASIEVGQTTTRTPWGAVATDDRFPLVWDANNAAVLEPAPGLTTSDLRGALTPALRRAGALYEHVEFWETGNDSPALDEFRRVGQRPDPDVVMVFEGSKPAPSPTGDPAVEELTEPDASFWAWYRESLREFGTELLSDDVLDQLVARTRKVFLPCGLRWFVGRIDGQRAGYTSLLALEGVGYLDNVVTMPSARRRGVATATVTAAVRSSLGSGDRHVFLLAERGGAPQNLYERLGFRVRSQVESYTRPLSP